MAALVAPRFSARSAPAALLLLLAAPAVGVLAVVHPAYAVALVAAAVVGFVVAIDLRALPLFLVFTMFVESLALGPGLRVGRIAGALALLVVLYHLLDRGRAGLRGNALLAAIGAYGAWNLASVYWADDSGAVVTTLSSYLLGLSYTLAFGLLVRTRRQLHAIFLVLAIGSLVFGVTSFVEYAGASGSARAAGLQGDPNYFAVYQVIALPAALVVAAFERNAQRRLLLYGVVGVIVLSVVSSLSRTGLIALVAVVLLTLLLPARYFFVRPGRKISYFLALTAAALAAIGVGSAAFVERAQTILNPGGSTGDRGAGRTDFWAAAWHGYSDHAWLGLGAGNFSPHALQLLQTTPGVDTRRNYVTQASVVHNGYLEQLTELGPVGLALWLAILALAMRYLIRAARRAHAAGDVRIERYAAGAAVALAGFAVSVIFLSNQLGKPFWILAGLALALDTTTRRWEPVLAARGSYDRGVGERVDERERRLQRELQSLLHDQQRMDRRRLALDERERAIAERERREAGWVDLGERESAVTARERELEDALRAVAESSARLVERERAIEARHRAEVAVLERELRETRAEIAAERAAIEQDHAEELERHEREAAGRIRRLEETPAPVGPTAPVARTTGGEKPLEPVAQQWDVEALAAAATRFGADFPPERRDEWQTYVVFLRDHAVDDVLPAGFDGLVWEIFGDLIEHARS